MGLSNAGRASATSIYKQVARLFIPSFYPSLSPRIACPVSSHCMSYQLCPISLHVLSAFYPSLSPRIGLVIFYTMLYWYDQLYTVLMALMNPKSAS
jgi:hypothetical protein